MPPLTDLSLVDDVHVAVAFGGAGAPEAVFVLDLHLPGLPVRLHETADAPLHVLSHDEAMASARRRLADIYPDVLSQPLSVSAEQHLGSEWAVRLVGPSGPGFDVRIGFVNGHPGTTRVRRIRTGEVVDSVGSG